MRTPQQAMKDAIKSGAVQAWIDGKPIEYTGDPTNHWTKFSGEEPPHFNTPIWYWRPAPEPKLRPWKDGTEVPFHAVYRDKIWDPPFWSLILGAGPAGIEISEGSQYAFVDYKDAASNGIYSTDGGKTWAPCGVMEGGE